MRVDTQTGWTYSVKKPGGCDKPIEVQLENNSLRQRANFFPLHLRQDAYRQRLDQLDRSSTPEHSMTRRTQFLMGIAVSGEPSERLRRYKHADVTVG